MSQCGCEGARGWGWQGGTQIVWLESKLKTRISRILHYLERCAVEAEWSGWEGVGGGGDPVPSNEVWTPLFNTSLCR